MQNDGYNLRSKSQNSNIDVAIKNENLELIFKFLYLVEKNGLHFEQGKKLLQWAISRQHLDIIDKLLGFAKNKNTELDLSQDQINTLLSLAVKNKNLDIAGKLFDLITHINKTAKLPKKCTTLLLLAINDENLNVVNKLLDFINRINLHLKYIQQAQGDQLLSLALQEQNLGIIDKLLALAQNKQITFSLSQEQANKVLKLVLENNNFLNNIFGTRFISDLFTSIQNNKDVFDFKIENIDWNQLLSSVLQDNKVWKIIDQLVKLVIETHPKGSVNLIFLNKKCTLENLNIIDTLLDLAKSNKITLSFSQDQGNKLLSLAIERQDLDIIDKLCSTIDSVSNDKIVLSVLNENMNILPLIISSKDNLESGIFINIMKKYEFNFNSQNPNNQLLMRILENHHNDRRALNNFLYLAEENLINLNLYTQGDMLLSWAITQKERDIISKLFQIAMIQKYIQFNMTNSQKYEILELNLGNLFLENFSKLLGEDRVIISSQNECEQGLSEQKSINSLNAEEHVAQNNTNSIHDSDPSYNTGDDITCNSDTEKNAAALTASIFNTNISEKKKQELYAMCQGYINKRVTIEKIEAQAMLPQKGFQIIFDYIRNPKIQEDNHIIPISILKLIIKDLTSTGIFLNKNDQNDIFSKIVFCWNDILEQEHLDIIKDDYDKLSNQQIVNKDEVKNFFRDKFFPYIFYAWDNKANMVFNQKKTDYLKEARAIKFFNDQAVQSFEMLRIQAKENQLKSQDAIDTLDSILDHFCGAALDMPICLRITIQEAIQNLDNNIQDYRSSENYGKSYFQNVMDYNVKNKHFDVTLSSKDTIVSYLKDIIYDIQRTFNIWTLSLKLELKGDAVIRQFSDACQKFLSVKNIGKKIIAGKIKIFNIKKQDVQEQVSKIALHKIIPVELCDDDNSNTVSIFQNHISSDQQNNLSQILNTIRDWNDDTSLSGATDTESEGITGC